MITTAIANHADNFRGAVNSRRFRRLALSAAVLAGIVMVASDAAIAANRAVQQVVTPAGVKAWIVEERSIPLVSLQLSFLGGALQDPPGKEGLTGMVAALLTEGAGDLKADAFARQAADHGAQIAFAGRRHLVNGELSALSSRFAAATELMRLAVAAPRFDDDAIARIREQRLSELELADSDPRSLAFNRWYAEAFPESRYGRKINGTPASLKAITADDIRQQARRLLARDALRIVVVGDIDREAALRHIDRIFGELPARAMLEPAPAPDIRKLAEPVVIEMSLPLTTAAFGALALPPAHADYPAQQLLLHIIGSGDFDARLMDEIRVKRGLAYSVSISVINDGAQSIMLGGMATRNGSMSEALEVLRRVLREVAADGPTADQLEGAKRYLTGSYVLDFDTNAKLAASMLRIWLDGKDPAFVEQRNAELERVTLEDVRRIARQLLAWPRFNVTIVGPRPTAN